MVKYWPLILLFSAHFSFAVTDNPQDFCQQENLVSPLAPKMTSLLPPFGLQSGGNLITITGKRFSEGATVWIGNSPCTGVSILNDKKLTCTTTRHSVGITDVFIINPDDHCGKLAKAFTFVPLVGIRPRSLSIAINNSVSLTGTRGQPPYHFSVVEGLGTVDPNTGVFTAPSFPGLTLVRITDRTGATNEALIHILQKLEIFPATLDSFTSDLEHFTVLGGVAPYSFSLSSKDLGTVDSETGELTIHGTSGAVTVTVTDQVGNHAEALVHIHPAPSPLSISPNPKTMAIQNTVPFLASGGFPPYTYSILSGKGVIQTDTGRFTASEQPGTAVILVEDAGKNEAIAHIQVNPALALYPHEKKLVPGEKLPIRVTGGVPPYQFTLHEGSELGKVDNKTGIFTALETPGKVTLHVTDSLGNLELSQIIISYEDVVPQILAAGYAHSCSALNGIIRCWGDNRYGQLGGGGYEKSLKPTPVKGLGRGTISIAAGYYHTCAIVHGGVKCWGDNRYGQLGDSLEESSPEPISVIGLNQDVRAIAAGAYHTCALYRGGVTCWGDNQYGQLGNKTTLPSDLPVQVQWLTKNVTHISAGAYHTCATTPEMIQCWGYNSAGQLGNGMIENALTPVSIPAKNPESNLLQANGYHTCALIHQQLNCWGYNGSGQLGNKDFKNQYLPTPSLSGSISALALGNAHTCALQSGSVWCWGDNHYGQLGLKATERSAIPIQIPEISNATTIAAGFAHTCVLIDKSVRCWGRNDSGQLGNHITQNYSLKPTAPTFIQ